MWLLSFILIISLRGVFINWGSKPKSIFLLVISCLATILISAGMLLMLIPDTTHPSEPGINELGLVAAFIGGVFGFGSVIVQLATSVRENIKN